MSLKSAIISLSVLVFSCAAPDSTSLSSRGEPSDRLVGRWDWTAGAVPPNAGLFRYWIFHESGDWEVSDGACLLRAGTFSLVEDRLTLKEGSDFTDEAKSFEYTIRFGQDDRMLMESSRGESTTWTRPETVVSPVLRR